MTTPGQVTRTALALALGSALAACGGAEGPEANGIASSRLAAANGLTPNGLAMNGLAMNGPDFRAWTAAATVHPREELLPHERHGAHRL